MFLEIQLRRVAAGGGGEEGGREREVSRDPRCGLDATGERGGKSKNFTDRREGIGKRQERGGNEDGNDDLKLAQERKLSISGILEDQSTDNARHHGGVRGQDGKPARQKREGKPVDAKRNQYMHSDMQERPRTQTLSTKYPSLFSTQRTPPPSVS